MNGALARTRPAFPASTVKAPRCTIQKNPTHLCAPRKMQKPSPLKSRNRRCAEGGGGAAQSAGGGGRGPLAVCAWAGGAAPPPPPRIGSAPHKRPRRGRFLGFSGLVRVCL